MPHNHFLQWNNKYVGVKDKKPCSNLHDKLQMLLNLQEYENPTDTNLVTMLNVTWKEKKVLSLSLYKAD